MLPCARVHRRQSAESGEQQEPPAGGGGRVGRQMHDCLCANERRRPLTEELPVGGKDRAGRTGAAAGKRVAEQPCLCPPLCILPLPASSPSPPLRPLLCLSGEQGLASGRVPACNQRDDATLSNLPTCHLFGWAGTCLQVGPTTPRLGGSNSLSDARNGTVLDTKAVEAPGKAVSNRSWPMRSRTQFDVTNCVSSFT